ncbi:hypothetical protein CHUAL_004981 [Chamberlinius hualienensis]
MGCIIITLLWTAFGLKCLIADPIVTTANGDVQGTTLLSFNGRSFYSFRGIPYAEPPVENLRFQPPLPVQNWSGVYDATKNGKACIQWEGIIYGDEDCLFIYVNTPYLPPNATQLPVLVYIHGGGFAQGSPHFNLYPNRFMDHDVVLVFIGYRLGPFGFLSTNDSVSSGNYGLLDQVEALKWVQTNIGAFGGDKNKVTIFGESAGGASVSYHQISPVSKDLFRAVICESGTAANHWALQNQTLYWAKFLASSLECPTDNSVDLVNCLKQKSAYDIVNATYNIGGYNVLNYPFGPCLEDETEGRFLTKLPDVILAEGSFSKVPAIIGTNKDEGDLTYSVTQEDYMVIDDTFYNEILPKLLYNLTRYERNLINVSYAVKAEYFDKIDVNNHTQVVRTAIDFNSDAAFKSSVDFTVRMLTKQSVPVYMYSFEYYGTSSYFNYTGEGEVAHGDEILYLFDNTNLFTPDDQYISDRLINMWVNFASDLNPTINEAYVWNPTPNQDELEYLKIATNSCTMETGFLTSKMMFWENQVPLIVYG